MNIFNSVKQYKPKSSVFDLSHDVKLTCRFGELVPILALDCLPGDKINISGETLIRFAPMIAPVMHRIDCTIHYFYVPLRILWRNFEKFISGKQLDPNASGGVPAYPYFDWGAMDLTTQDAMRLADFLGIPPKPAAGAAAGTLKISAMPFAAYKRIWFEYYRDQNLINPSADVESTMLADGNNDVAFLLNPPEGFGWIKKRAWEHDYFTAALPWAQKGPDVLIPGATGGEITLQPNKYGKFVQPANGDQPPATTEAIGVTGGTGFVQGMTSTSSYAYDPNGSLVTGGGVDNGTINDLRKAYKLQEWLEKNARGGTRLTETIRAHWGVTSSDKRMQRPEYITGLKTPVVISEVLNTAGVEGSLAQGNMAGHGVAVSSGKAGSYFCEEHGILMGIMSIMPKTAYQQGIAKSWRKFDYLDFGFPEFAHLGEQPVLNSEIYAYTAQQEDTFGYVPRYAEYKFMPNRVATDFRTTLSYWHMGRIFDTQPNLNRAFVECQDDKRIFAVTDPNVDCLYVDVLNHIKAVRALPKYGNPGW